MTAQIRALNEEYEEYYPFVEVITVSTCRSMNHNNLLFLQSLR